MNQRMELSETQLRKTQQLDRALIIVWPTLFHLLLEKLLKSTKIFLKITQLKICGNTLCFYQKTMEKQLCMMK